MAEWIEPAQSCPKCGAREIMVESADPLEEFCLNHPCDYYRAELAGGGVVRE